MLLMPQLESSGINTRRRTISAPRRDRLDLDILDLDIGVYMGLRFASRMGDGALLGVAHRLGVAPERPRLVVMAARLPRLAALGQLALAEIDLERALLGVEADDVAVLQQADRAAHRRLRPDMADAEAAGGTGEAAVGDERHLVAQALAVDRRRGRQHLAHAGAAARPLVADDDDIALLVLVIAHRLEGVLLAVEAERLAGELQGLHASDLH